MSLWHTLKTSYTVRLSWVKALHHRKFISTHKTTSFPKCQHLLKSWRHGAGKHGMRKKSLCEGITRRKLSLWMERVLLSHWRKRSRCISCCGALWCFGQCFLQLYSMRWFSSPCSSGTAFWVPSHLFSLAGVMGEWMLCFMLPAAKSVTLCLLFYTNFYAGMYLFFTLQYLRERGVSRNFSYLVIVAVYFHW